ncbi:MAG: 5-(carboxyamino)imidazole ribonucleotide mutase [Fidelibacterota bacterium]
MAYPEVAVILGSKSDLDYMENCFKYLEYFGIDYVSKILSAHRNPEATVEFAASARRRGFKVIIAAAGMAAHLPGVVASRTTLPVIGVPIPSSHLNGTDALISMVQMPAGVPVATLAIGSAGAANAAILAAEIISLENRELEMKIDEFRRGGSKI